MQDSVKKTYNKIVIFPGGGTRFAMYCGMYAALEDIGYTPDLIIGTCGGAIATGIINSFATNEDRKKYLESDELYRFIRTTTLTKEKKLHRIGLLCIRKILNNRKAPYIENVFNRYLVDMPQDISIQLPSLVPEMGKNVKSILIGAKVLFNKVEIGNKRFGRKLYSKVLFADNDTARNIDLENIRILLPDYLSGAVAPEISLPADVPMHTAMRISLSDMFYVPPVLYQGSYFTGGAIDLVPIELAKSMGEYIISEKKKPYSAMEEALVRAVLGYSGNKRLHNVEKQGVNKWIDLRNATRALDGHYCKKGINWRHMQISIALPTSLQQHAKDMDMQWNYGYECAIKAFTE